MRAGRMLVAAVMVVAGCAGEPASPSITQVGTAPSTTIPATVTTETSPTSITTVGPETAAGDERIDDRRRMVDDQIERRGVSDPAVLAAMRAVPRHRFVGGEWQDLAYGDHPLPIGHGQTISQPLIVALMSEALAVEPGARVLEIGTGSGYQAAVLAEMGLEVYSIEIIPELADGAAATLGELGYDVRLRTGDGYFGWQEHAPFDGIMVTAAPDHVPQPMVQQLAPGASMVIPVGPIGAVQTLWRFTLDAGGELAAESLGPVSFVPLTRSG